MQNKKRKWSIGDFSAFYPVALMFFVVGIITTNIVFIAGGIFFLICAINEGESQSKGPGAQNEGPNDTSVSE